MAFNAALMNGFPGLRASEDHLAGRPERLGFGGAAGEMAGRSRRFRLAGAAEEGPGSAGQGGR